MLQHRPCATWPTSARRSPGLDAGATVIAPALPEDEQYLRDLGVTSPTCAAGEGPGRTMVMAAPTTENLDRVAQLLGSGTLKVPVQSTYELDRAAEALQAIGTTHSQGKRAIRIA